MPVNLPIETSLIETDDFFSKEESKGKFSPPPQKLKKRIMRGKHSAQ